MNPNNHDHESQRKLTCRVCMWTIQDKVCSCGLHHGYQYADPKDHPNHVCKTKAGVADTSAGDSTPEVIPQKIFSRGRLLWLTSR